MRYHQLPVNFSPTTVADDMVAVVEQLRDDGWVFGCEALPGCDSATNYVCRVARLEERTGIFDAIGKTWLAAHTNMCRQLIDWKKHQKPLNATRSTEQPLKCGYCRDTGHVATLLVGRLAICKCPYCQHVPIVPSPPKPKCPHCGRGMVRP